VLDLRGTAECDKACLIRLSRCENLRRLRALDVSQHRSTTTVRSNKLGRSACRRLRERFGAGVRYGPGPTPVIWHQPRAARWYDE
jgi:hypothetical protein